MTHKKQQNRTANPVPTGRTVKHAPTHREAVTGCRAPGPARVFRVTVRYTETEYRELVGEADLSGLSMAGYLRARSLGRKTSARVDLKTVNELRRLGGLLKHIHVESRGGYSELTAEGLRELIHCVRRIAAGSATRAARTMEEGEATASP